MFIMTARVPKRRLLAGAVTAACCCLAVIIALGLTLGRRAVTTSAEVGNIRDNDDRVAYLTGLGWQVAPEAVSAEELLIPDTFDDSYADYLALQSGQGFDLTKYCGKRVKRYIYEITNHPSGKPGVQAALLIYRNRIIGGQLQAADGSFVLPLAPDAAPSASPAPSAVPSAIPSPEPSAAPSAGA